MNERPHRLSKEQKKVLSDLARAAMLPKSAAPAEATASAAPATARTERMEPVQTRSKRKAQPTLVAGLDQIPVPRDTKDDISNVATNQNVSDVARQDSGAPMIPNEVKLDPAPARDQHDQMVLDTNLALESSVVHEDSQQPVLSLLSVAINNKKMPLRSNVASYTSGLTNEKLAQQTSSLSQTTRSTILRRELTREEMLEALVRDYRSKDISKMPIPTSVVVEAPTNEGKTLASEATKYKENSPPSTPRVDFGDKIEEQSLKALAMKGWEALKSLIVFFNNFLGFLFALIMYVRDCVRAVIFWSFFFIECIALRAIDIGVLLAGLFLLLWNLRDTKVFEMVQDMAWQAVAATASDTIDQPIPVMSVDSRGQYSENDNPASQCLEPYVFY